MRVPLHTIYKLTPIAFGKKIINGNNNHRLWECFEDDFQDDFEKENVLH